jgi:lysophospholipase L1-like esterase
MTTVIWKVASFITIAILFVIVLFFVLELIFRKRQVKRHGVGSREPQALRDRFVAWRLNPSFGRIDIQHNAQGFRHSTNVSIRKPPGSARIFFLGGSTAYGAQGSFTHIDNSYSRIHNHELIDAFLEQKLNITFPSKRWEVINSATSGYRIHQQLALIQARILRYQPDLIILMDGYNDFIELYHFAQAGSAAEYDVYQSTPGGEEFDALANPRSLHSLATFANTWLRSTSVLYRVMQDHVPGAVRDPWVYKAGGDDSFPEPVQLLDLSAAERSGAVAALRYITYYVHVARQIHRILELEGIKVLFLLQPILILSHKPLTDSEKKMVDYERAQGGRLYSYLFRQIYFEIAQGMSEAAQKDGFLFLNLIDVFDQTPEQTFSDFAHLTPDGNRVVAKRLFEFLTDVFAEI